MFIRLAAVGTASTLHFIEQDEAAALAAGYTDDPVARQRVLRALYRRTGARRRGSVLLDGSRSGRPEFLPLPRDPGDRGPSTASRMERYAAEGPVLAAQASQVALTKAGVGPERIRHVVSVSCTGFAAPGIDVKLIHRLGLRPTTSRTNVGFMGCHGALNGLRVAGALARTGDPVLLCAVELCSLHFQYGWAPERIVANALFGDGAAAAVVTSGGEAGWRVTANGACLIPSSEDAMTWSIGDHGFLITLSARVPDLIHEHLRPWLDGWLEENGLGVSDVKSWAIHPGGPRIVEAAGDAIGLDREATQISREVLAECGNMSSPTVLFILERLMRRGARTPCVALGFGPGLAVEAILLT